MKVSSLRPIFPLLLIVLVASGVVRAAERQPFERYQSIVDRQMFGDPPPGFDPDKLPSEVAKSSGKADVELTKEQEQVKKSIRFSVINVTSAGETVVGFSDNGDPKNPLHYYLKVGESQNGWTVKEASAEEATMTVEKDGVEVSLKLGGDSGAAPIPAVAPQRGGLLDNRMSLRGRRQLQAEQMQADAAKRAEEEKARQAREEEEKKQREAERAEQREQLLRIQEELRKAREAREANKPAPDPAEGDL